jgi:fumarate hydratase subunit beta
MMKISAPLDEETISGLHAGDEVLVNGVVFGARDAVHIKLGELIRTGAKLPFDITGQIIYYVGPTPGRSEHDIGSAGPTTSSRMDFCTPLLISGGLKGMIGKGSRSGDVTEAIVKYKAVYLGAVGGIGALLGEKIVHAEVVAYRELGPEALWKFIVKDFPAIVINDVYGGDWYKEVRLKIMKEE